MEKTDVETRGRGDNQNRDGDAEIRKKSRHGDKVTRGKENRTR